MAGWITSPPKVNDESPPTLPMRFQIHAKGTLLGRECHVTIQLIVNNRPEARSSIELRAIPIDSAFFVFSAPEYEFSPTQRRSIRAQPDVVWRTP